MNPIPIIAFIAGAGIVASVFAFAWACITRQFTGYDLGNLPLESRDPEIDSAAGVDREAGVLTRRLRAAVLIGALVMVFGLIGWSIYQVIAAAESGPAS